jgi:hypothetical protein
MAPLKDAQHSDAADKGRHIFESRQEPLDVVGNLLRGDHQHRNGERERRVDKRFQPRHLPSHATEIRVTGQSRSAGTADATSSWRPFICRASYTKRHYACTNFPRFQLTTQPTERQHIRDQIDTTMIFARADFVKVYGSGRLHRMVGRHCLGRWLTADVWSV